MYKNYITIHIIIYFLLPTQIVIRVHSVPIISATSPREYHGYLLVNFIILQNLYYIYFRFCV